MRKIAILGLFILTTSVIITACQKELSVDTLGGNGGGNTTLVGNWKFVDMNVVTETTVEESDGLLVAKAINLSDYITRNNIGTITFTDTKMSSVGVAYTIVDTVSTKLYVNGLLVNETATPFTFDVPPTNGENNYTRVNTDSLYFPNGGLTPGINGAPNQPAGAKLRFDGSKLYMTTKGVYNETTIDQGVTTTQNLNVVAIITLQRQ